MATAGTTTAGTSPTPAPTNSKDDEDDIFGANYSTTPLGQMSYRDMVKDLKLRQKHQDSTIVCTGTATAVSQRLAELRRRSRTTPTPPPPPPPASSSPPPPPPPPPTVGGGFASTGIAVRNGFSMADDNAGDDEQEEPAAAADDPAHPRPAAATSQQPPNKKAKAVATRTARFTLHCFARLIAVIADPSTQYAVGRIHSGLDSAGRDGVDDPKLRKPWNEVAEVFNSETEFVHIAYNSTSGNAVSTPRNDVTKLDPNHHCTDERTGEFLQGKWNELTRWLTEPMKQWNKSGSGNEDGEEGSATERSISDFATFFPNDMPDRYGPVLKYAHLTFKEDGDLMNFASKLISDGAGTETGGKSI
eukprot:COSAG01_NODE_13547_length_1569_cov_1.444898_1_plen_360_part_00